MKLAGALAIVYVVWGSTYLGMAVADRTLPPLLMLSVRFLIAGALLYALAARRGELAVRPSRREWRAATIVGTALLVLDTGGVAWAVQRVPSGTAALLVASVPLFMAVIDRACFGIRLPLGAVAGHRDRPRRRRDPRRAFGQRRPARRRRAALRVLRLGGRLRIRARRADAARGVRRRRDADADGRRAARRPRARDRRGRQRCIRRRSRPRRSARCSS